MKRAALLALALLSCTPTDAEIIVSAELPPAVRAVRVVGSLPGHPEAPPLDFAIDPRRFRIQVPAVDAKGELSLLLEGLDQVPPAAGCVLTRGEQRLELHGAGAYEITVPMRDLAVPECQAAAPDGGAGQDLGSADLAQRPDLMPTWTSGMAASWTLGNAGLFGSPYDLCWTGSRLYVSDPTYHQVLVFEQLKFAATDQQAAPTLVVGRSAAGTDRNAPAASDKTLNGPRGLWCDAGSNVLLVADSLNHRVMAFNNVLSNQPSAQGVIGQADFMQASANRGATTAANGLSTPYGVLYRAADSRIYIADTANHRVVVHTGVNPQRLDVLSLSSASIVLGQSGPTAGASGSGDSGLNRPVAVGRDASGRVAVSDSLNHRVMVYPFPTQTGVAADALLGQRQFGDSSPGTSESALRAPGPLTSTGEGLFLADVQNNRVLLYRQGLPAKGALGAVADVVFGQKTLATRDTGASLEQMNNPTGLLLVQAGNGGRYLLVADSNNGRVVVFALR